MKNKAKNQKKQNSQFISDYKKILESAPFPMSVRTEWNKKGDVIQKFTMYDTNYKIVPTLESLGSTTLIKKL